MGILSITDEVRRQYLELRKVNSVPRLLFVDTGTYDAIREHATEQFALVKNTQLGEYWFRGLRLYRVLSDTPLIKVTT